MKFLNKKQKNNKGFSLVELIVVIAIMVVLVAVLAPVFSKYIESSRRSTDVQNANQIAEAVLADFADNKDVTAENYKPEAIKEWPVVAKGDVDGKKGQQLKFTYNKDTNHCKVYVNGLDSYDLTIEEQAQQYKDWTSSN